MIGDTIRAISGTTDVRPPKDRQGNSIPSILDNTDDEISRLSDVVEALYGNVAPLLRDVEPSPTLASETVSADSDLGTRLLLQQGKITGSIRRLRDLINRIDL